MAEREAADCLGQKQIEKNKIFKRLEVMVCSVVALDDVEAGRKVFVSIEVEGEDPLMLKILRLQGNKKKNGRALSKPVNYDGERAIFNELLVLNLYTTTCTLKITVREFHESFLPRLRDSHKHCVVAEAVLNVNDDLIVWRHKKRDSFASLSVPVIPPGPLNALPMGSIHLQLNDRTRHFFFKNVRWALRQLDDHLWSKDRVLSDNKDRDLVHIAEVFIMLRTEPILVEIIRLFVKFLKRMRPIILVLKVLYGILTWESAFVSGTTMTLLFLGMLEPRLLPFLLVGLVIMRIFMVVGGTARPLGENMPILWEVDNHIDLRPGGNEMESLQLLRVILVALVGVVDYIYVMDAMCYDIIRRRRHNIAGFYRILAMVLAFVVGAVFAITLLPLRHILAATVLFVFGACSPAWAQSGFCLRDAYFAHDSDWASASGDRDLFAPESNSKSKSSPKKVEKAPREKQSIARSDSIGEGMGHWVN